MPIPRADSVKAMEPDEEFCVLDDPAPTHPPLRPSPPGRTDAVLGNVLRQAIAAVPPYVVLPATIGGIVSVNLYTASVGRSGQGKGAADAAGFDAVQFQEAAQDFRSTRRARRPAPAKGSRGYSRAAATTSPDYQPPT